LFFPLGWLFLTAFKTELQAIAVPPLFVFEPTLDNFGEVQRRSDYLLYARNSLITSLGSTVIGLAIAAPAAYSMAFFRTKRTRDILNADVEDLVRGRRPLKPGDLDAIEEGLIAADFGLPATQQAMEVLREKSFAAK